MLTNADLGSPYMYIDQWLFESIGVYKRIYCNFKWSSSLLLTVAALVVYLLSVRLDRDVVDHVMADRKYFVYGPRWLRVFLSNNSFEDVTLFAWEYTETAQRQVKSAPEVTSSNHDFRKVDCNEKWTEKRPMTRSRDNCMTSQPPVATGNDVETPWRHHGNDSDVIPLQRRSHMSTRRRRCGT